MRTLLAPLAVFALVVGACDGDVSETTAATSTTVRATTSTTSSALTTTTATPVAPDPQGVIAYNRDGELWLINADGTDDHPLAIEVIVEGGPSWSPDGTTLAFSGSESGPDRVTLDIWTVSNDGSGLTRLTNSTGVSLLEPSWSSDGSTIVFGSTDGDLWTIAARGGTPERLTSDEPRQSHPTWAPDGSLIAYCNLPLVGAMPTENDIWVIEPDGSNPRRLTDVGGACLPAWSPDSSRLAFTGFVQLDDATDYADVWVMGRDGSDQRNVTNDPERFDRAPTWSPDGLTIAFDSAGPIVPLQDPEVGRVIEHDPPADVYLMPAAGGPKVRLTTSSAASGAPAWSPIPTLSQAN